MHTIKSPDQLEFDSDVFPTIIGKPDAVTTLAQACDWLQSHQSEVEAHLESSGAVLFRGFPCSDADSFDRFSGAFNYPNFTYKESLSNAVRINYTERVFTANEAPKEVEIFLHHEMAQTPISPSKLFFFCQSAALVGGATPLCRSDQLFQALQQLKPELAQQFIDKGLKYKMRMLAEDDQSSGQGRSWRSTLNVQERSQAETKLRDLGYQWEWQSDGSLNTITPKLSAVRQHSTGRLVFHNQLLAAYLGWPGVKTNPANGVTFGDDSHLRIEDLETIASLAPQFTYDLNWQDGDVALVDNRLTMHGRRPYSGERKRQVLVALAA